jgi:hypothetical protein
VGRPRTPAQILDLRGAFSHNPDRRREDAPGAGPFERDPPTHLAKDVVPAWKYLVDRLPAVALTSSDEIAVEQAARVLCGLWALQDMGPLGLQSQEFKRLDDSLRQWLIQLGMTIQARTKINPAGEKKPSKFGKFKSETPKD